MKKKIASIILSCALALSIGACGNSSNEQQTSVTESESISQEENEKAAEEAAAEAAALQAAQEQALQEQQQKENEKSEIESFVEKPLTDLMTKLTELGYSATYYADGVDFTSFISDMQADYSVKAVDVDADAKTATVDLISNSDLQVQQQKDALSEKLSTGAAWVAAENYGESQYPYGFELHYFLGKIAEEPYDENTWFLKAECTLTNQYDAEAEGTCEVTVTGTDDAPQITSFLVY